MPITLHGHATDAEEGTIPNGRLSWTVIRHHSTHTHPFLGPVTGNDVTFSGPVPEDLLAATNSYLEIQLTATDLSGASATVTRDIQSGNDQCGDGQKSRVHRPSC